MRVEERKTLVWVALGGLLIRALYFLEHTTSAFYAVPLLDQKYYDSCARAFMSGVHAPDLMDGFRPLLYPFLLSWFYRLGGALDITIALILQHFAGVGIALIVAYMAMRLFNDLRAGAVAGALYLLAGPPLYFEGELLIVTLFTLLLTLFLVMLSRALRSTVRASWLWWAASGGVLALAAQARPNALIVMAVFPLLACCFAWWKRKWAVRGAMIGLVAGLLVQTCGAWLNSRVTGHWTWTGGAGGINFYVGNKRGADGMIPRQEVFVTYEGDYRDSMQVAAEKLYRERAGEAFEPDISPEPSAVSSFWFKEGWREIREAPGEWLSLMARKLWLLLWNREVSNNKDYEFIAGEESRLLLFLPVRWWLLLALFPWGLWSVSRKRKMDVAAPFLLVMALYAAGVLLFFVNGRYRIPLWPPMALFAGGGAVQLVEVARAGKLHRAWEFILATVVLVLLSLFNWFGAEPQEDARSYFFRAKARYLKGYFEQSLDDAEQSVALDPSNADAYIQLGNSAYACGAHKQARDAYQRAVQLAPNEPRAYNNLGVAWEALDDPGKAYTAYLLAVGLNPGQETALINAALIELRAGRLDLARKHIRTASREDAQRPDLLCAEAFLARREGRIAEAERLVARASRMAPDLVQQLVQKDLVPLDPAALESAAEDTVPSAVDQSAASSD